MNDANHIQSILNTFFTKGNVAFCSSKHLKKLRICILLKSEKPPPKEVLSLAFFPYPKDLKAWEERGGRRERMRRNSLRQRFVRGAGGPGKKTSSSLLLLPDLGVSQGLGREEVQVSPGRWCRHRDMSPPPPSPSSQSSPIMGSRSRWRIRMEEAQVSKES